MKPPASPWPAQEPRRAPNAMVATVNPLATAAAIQVLRQGGNALDAAVAAGAVLTVVEPWSGQLGGDAFILVCDGRTGKVTAVNGSGAAPHRATPELYQRLGDMPNRGWLAATVPGVVDAWQVALERFGTRSLSAMLEPAVEYADHGFPLTTRQCRSIEELTPVINAFPETAALFLPFGHPPRPGYLLKQPALARTLRGIQEHGAADFYQGEIASRLVSASEKAGGLFTLRDFSEHGTVVDDPLQTTYRGWTVVEQPPVSQGVIVLLALAILEQFDLPHLQSETADMIHLQVEAHKLALADRLAQLGDPRFQPMRIADLLSSAHARRQAQRLDRGHAGQIAAHALGPPDTTYLCVVDKDRNIASYIQSLYGGNGVLAGDTGILLNNRMACFTLEADSPNRVAPGKRPIHTLNSWLLFRDGGPRFAGGTPGAFWQVQTNLQVICQLIDYGADVQAALDAPRWTMGPQTSWSNTALKLEARFGDDVLQELQARGHEAQMVGAWAAGGSVQVIGLQPDGSLIGAGDPRPGTSSVIGY